MKVTKREVKDYEGLVGDTLYCINDNGKLMFSLENYSWSTSIRRKSDIEQSFKWQNEPYHEFSLITSVKDLMKDVYDEFKLIKKCEKSFERD